MFFAFPSSYGADSSRPCRVFGVIFVQELGLIPTPKTAAGTAAFLKGTLLLDKSMLGEYLSRGPADKYPFNAQVRAKTNSGHRDGRSGTRREQCCSLCL